MRRVRLDPKHPQAFALMTSASYGEKADLLAKLLSLGFPVSDDQNGGSSLFGLLLQGKDGVQRVFVFDDPEEEITTEDYRELFFCVKTHPDDMWF
jgi:hypothetical protein